MIPPPEVTPPAEPTIGKAYHFLWLGRRATGVVVGISQRRHRFVTLSVDGTHFTVSPRSVLHEAPPECQP